MPLIDGSVSSFKGLEHTATLKLIGGRAYPIRLEFFKTSRDPLANVTLAWQPPHGARQLIPARNLAPAPVAWTARILIALFRTFHPVIIAILFVKAVGFGALAGMLALIFASMGFLSKLLAEAVEEMSMKQVEAVRATGSPFLSVIIMGIMPQVMPRFIGFCAYQLDSNLRNSALVGLVGGGGIGATLFTAFQRFDYDFVLTIVLAIIAAVMVGEVISGLMRRMFQ